MSQSEVRKVQTETQQYVNEAVLLPTAALLIALQYEWLRRVNSLVPEPYLDEVFHVPQANAFWQGRWRQWDDKITTPPGLYLYSILISKITHESTTLDASQLRWTNTVLLYVLTILCAVWVQIAKRASLERTLSTALAIFSSPLLFFFSSLYYTDIFAAVTVMFTYCLWQTSLNQTNQFIKYILQIMVFLSGEISLTARQTNIFWVAIFTGGLQVVATVKRSHQIHDPPLAAAHFQDFATMVLSLVISALQTIPQLLIDLAPQLGLLASFAAFVFFNGGVVLGDKTNHVAGIHLAQMLYLPLFMVGLSWPLVLPHLINAKKKEAVMPRAGIAVLLLMVIAAVVQLNTIIHPFLLADNRHFTFYAFKALRLAPWGYYALIPVYGLCAWLVLLIQQSPHQATNKDKQHSTTIQPGGNTTSFFAVWLIASALSLVTAPLVEPRYFIIPWLVWRLHAPEAEQILSTSDPKAGIFRHLPAFVSSAIIEITRRSVWIEIVWHMTINLMVCGLFLYRGFSWPQEPGKTQRFMW